MNMLSIWRKAPPIQTTLADDAFSLLGSFDISKGRHLSDINEMRERLDALARHTLNALAAIDRVIARELHVRMAEQAAQGEAAIEEALDGIELDLTPVSPSSSKRKKGAA
jgi:hypothetical protein